MSSTMHLPAPSWASAHRALVTVLALVLAAALAVTITLVVTRLATSDSAGWPTDSPGSGLSSCLTAPAGTAC